MLRKAARQSTESEVTVCLTPEVKGKTFQEKGVVNGAITAGDERKLTSAKTTNPGLGPSSAAEHASDAQGQEFDLQHSERKQKQTKVEKASSIKVSGLICSGAVWVELEGCGPSNQTPGGDPTEQKLGGMKIKQTAPLKPPECFRNVWIGASLSCSRIFKENRPERLQVQSNEPLCASFWPRLWKRLLSSLLWMVPKAARTSCLSHANSPSPCG